MNSDHDAQQTPSPTSTDFQRADLLRQFLEQQLRDPCAPVRVGNFVIGAVDHVNGASSRQSVVAISRYEAKLLVRHWLERAESIERWWNVTGQVGSDETRESAYAYHRVNDLCESGLITDAEVGCIRDEVWNAHADEWEPIPDSILSG
jgi:hypothetical protein